jgi:hypothetical protein
VSACWLRHSSKASLHTGPDTQPSYLSKDTWANTGNASMRISWENNCRLNFSQKRQRSHGKWVGSEPCGWNKCEIKVTEQNVMFEFSQCSDDKTNTHLWGKEKEDESERRVIPL